MGRWGEWARAESTAYGLEQSMRTDWWSCNGQGNLDLPTDALNQREPFPPVPPSPHLPLSRRGFLLGGALAAVGWASRETTALADLSLNPRKREPEGDILVT